METLAGIIGSLSGIILGSCLTYYFHCQRTKFENFLRFEFEIFTDLYFKIIKCYKTLHLYANLLTSYQRNPQIFYDKVQPAILEFEETRDKAIIFIKDQKVREYLDEFSKYVKQVGTSIHIHLVQGESDKYPPEVSNPDFQGLSKAYSNIVKVFESKFDTYKIIFW